jgi:NADP-dependent 3-hydroxy acid dehydrogenase YdfG
MSTEFSGKTVIITGAGKGIGRACAQLMAARGARVIAMARTQADLDGLAADCGAQGIKVDLADNAAARAAMKAAGTADYLINCAGTNVLETVLEMTEDGYETVMGINLRAALICAQEFARARIAAGGGGVILNVTSIAGHRGFQGHMAYAASKAGLEGATRVRRQDRRHHRRRLGHRPCHHRGAAGCRRHRGDGRLRQGRAGQADAELGPKAMAQVTDLLDAESCARWCRKSCKRSDHIDILHCNAGTYIGGDLVETTPTTIDRMLNLNVNAVMKNVHAVIPHMIARKTGDIIVTCSVAGHFPVPWEPVYSGSKWAITCFVQTMRRQLNKQGIRVGRSRPAR